ncbi:hypothetical protein DITRI_Ditri01bG0149700 [Diplodiscus trichospermus]
MDFLITKIDESWDTPANLVGKMNDLKQKLEELNALKEDTMSRTSMELHPRKKLKKEVELWFRNVERLNSEIQELDQKFEESNVVSRGFLKGIVFKKIEEVEELKKGKFHDSLVVDDPGWIGQVLSTAALFGESAKTCMKEIWDYLMGCDVQKVGVWGMGGVGKTTIMKLINNQLLKETEKFNSVIWVTVSKEINISKLQNNIARAMQVALLETEDETIRAGMIYEMLARKGRYVLILDDLWDRLSLEEVGIPEPSNGSKLVVTTRILDVCHYLDCRVVKVPTLSKSDAWSLFLEKIGKDILNYPHLLPIVESVSVECAGLPLAIVLIGCSMKGVRTIYEWRNALNELSRCVESVSDIDEKVFRQLQFSYDRLGNEKVKYCFLYCSLFPEDWEIGKDYLIKWWIEEGFVDEMDRAHTIMNKLINNCLLENVKIGFVKLHDLVRDMALRITRVKPRFLARAGTQLKEIPNVEEWTEDLEKVSLMANKQLQIPSQMPPLKCQKLTTLLLSKCSIKSIPECFFEQMRGLKILDLSYNRFIKSLPNSISNLESLTTLLLGWCEDLEKLPSFLKLQALKKLDLEGTNIKDIPHGMEKLVNLKYLDLSDTRITGIADRILAKFTSLQHLALNIFNETFVRGEEIGGLRKLELFQGRFSDLKELNSYVQALHAQLKTPSQYYIHVGNQLDDSAFYCELEKFIELNSFIICKNDIKVLSDVAVLNVVKCTVDLCEEEAFFCMFIPVPYDIFSSLYRIEVVNCKNIKKLFSSNWVLQNLRNLNLLRVRGCQEIEEIIASESELEEEGRATIKFTFPKLCSLELSDLSELKSICGENGVMVCDYIQKIHIKDCPKLRRIPLHLPLEPDSQPSTPNCLKIISVYPKEWWEMVELDHPNAKSLLEPFVLSQY